MLLPVWNQHGIPAKAIQNHVDQAVVKPQLHRGAFPGVHLEQTVGVLYQVFPRQLRAGRPAQLGQLNVAHPIHPVGGDTVAGGVGQQVAVFVVLAQAVGAGLVIPIPVFPGAVQGKVKIPEGDLLVSAAMSPMSTA